MKSFSYTLPGTTVTFPAAVIGPKPVIVINPDMGTLFCEWKIHKSAADLEAGDPPVAKISKTFTGPEVEELARTHAQLLGTLFTIGRTIGEDHVGAQ